MIVACSGVTVECAAASQARGNKLLRPRERRRSMQSHRHYDVIIIGTGAGGGTLARKLAPSGKRILILERGDYVKREPDNWNPRAVNLEAKYNAKEVWYDRDGKPLHPHTNY